MAKFVKHFSFVMVLIVLISAICMPISAEAATAKGTISAVTNTASGIQVKWTKDSTKAGYYIYRKSGSSGTYKKVKTVKSASTTSWTDTNVTNGTKYVYKVRSYKGSKITANNSTKTIYRMAKPAITVSRASGTSIKVKASNSKATGFQIRYSTKSNFSSYKSVSVAGTSLNKTLKNLAKNTKYYVKVRAYKTVSGKKYYGVFSSVKSATTYYVAKASIASLSRVSETSINVKASNSKATGFQIRYSTKSDFSNYKSVSVAGINLNKTLTDLTKGTTYYVKVRAYKTVNSTKYYGSFSDVKSVVTTAEMNPAAEIPYTAYVKGLTAIVYPTADSVQSEKSGTTLYYMTPVTVISTEKSSTSGKWMKIKYDGNYYYYWQGAGAEEKFTKELDTYDNYTNPANSQFQQEVVDYAVWIFKNCPTEYKYLESHANYPEGGYTFNEDTGFYMRNGNYVFNCSTFVSHVLNHCMQKYNPVYNLSADLKTLHDRTMLYNQGLAGEFTAKMLFSGNGVINWNILQPGDVLFFNSNGDGSNAIGYNHCAIYLGNKQFIHSSRLTSGVKILPLEGFYAEDIICAIRFIPGSFENLNLQATATKKITAYKSIDLNDKGVHMYNADTVSIPAGEQFTLEFTNTTWNMSGKEHWGSVLYNGNHYFIRTGVDGSDVPYEYLNFYFSA